MGMKPKSTPWQRKATSALRDSIAHWERMRDRGDASGERPFATHCACCQAFASCVGCPVHLRTGMSCDGTPWEDAVDEWCDALCSCDSPEFKRAADAEIVYLRETLRLVERGEVTP